MRSGHPQARFIASGCLALALVFGASAADAKKVPPTRLLTAEVEPVEEQLLDVGIQLFQAGLPAGDEEALEEQGIFADVRRAEARFIPVRLMDTLQSTGFWGAVRVVPRGAGQMDLLVEGRILWSSGSRLELEVQARDSRGKVWLKPKVYKADALERGYRDDAPVQPFQHLYNHIANQLLKVLNKADDADLRTIRQVSSLRFAADLAPAVFDGYLDQDRKGRRVIKRLPAAGDPMARRVDAIRERDHLFIDTLTDHFTAFQWQMSEPYHSWRRFSFEEEKAMKKLKRQARNRKIAGALAIAGAVLARGEDAGAVRDLAIYGGIYSIQSGIGKAQEAKLHRESLRELALSFDSEVKPALVEVEGRTLRLTGSVEQQFVEWRRLLREMFAEETGELLSPDGAGEVASSPETLN